MSDIDLDELERLERAATPGPWECGTAMCCPDMGWIHGGSARVCGQTAKSTHAMSAEDAELMTAMRNALPVLIAEVRRLRQEADDDWRMKALRDSLRRDSQTRQWERDAVVQYLRREADRYGGPGNECGGRIDDLADDIEAEEHLK